MAFLLYLSNNASLVWIFQEKKNLFFIDPKLLNNSIHVLAFCKQTHQLNLFMFLAN